ncbi:MAG: preprotein translocase subunit SecE [Thermoguttaceae bacterium]
MNAFLQELLHVGIYKKNQGRITRQVTWGAIALAVVVGFYRLSQTLMSYRYGPLVSWYVPSLLALACLWMAYRLVNVPRVADFLIAVEAEMNKVSWPSRAELFRSSLVVLVTILSLAVVLFVFDAFWSSFFRLLGII